MAIPAYSDPADEQAFVTKEINSLMRTPDWRSTVVIVNYDDSDGWYDHVYSGVTNPSLSPADNLTNTTSSRRGPTSGQCGPKPQTKAPLAGEQGRCGFGPRLPMLVISPFARVQPRRPQPDRPGLDHQLHRVQLAPAGDPRVGRSGSVASTDRSEGIAVRPRRDVRLQASARATRLILSPVTGQPLPGAPAPAVVATGS